MECWNLELFLDWLVHDDIFIIIDDIWWYFVTEHFNIITNWWFTGRQTSLPCILIPVYIPSIISCVSRQLFPVYILSIISRVYPVN